MGMMFPADLAAWQRWQASRQRLRRLRHAFDRGRRTPPPLFLHTRGGDATAVFAVDAATPAAVASTTSPLAFLGDTPVAVLAPADVSAHLPGEWSVEAVTGSDLPRAIAGIRAVVAMGAYLPAGAQACAWASQLGARLLIVQHGLLAPQAPPLPAGAHLLAFSEADAAFWRAGRADVTAEAIGSHLLWQAAQTPRTVSADTTPVFLGQLHGAELPRQISGRTAELFCERTGAAYRPHPAETDILSRLQHRRWRRRGIEFAAPGPLLDAGRSVVSIFSTGVLEAAAAGIPAWVTCVRPPAWVHEFWDRYGLAPWGGSPTPVPEIPEVEPASAVADRVRDAAEGAS